MKFGSDPNSALAALRRRSQTPPHMHSDGEDNASTPTRDEIVHVIAHTHWDREWYLPAGRFRQRLATLIDEHGQLDRKVARPPDRRGWPDVLERQCGVN